MKGKDELYDPEESARRRDEVIRRMANTPPQPKSKNPSHRPKRKRKAVADREADNGHAARGH